MTNQYSYKDYNDFFNFIFEKPKSVISESDITFMDGKGRGQIYYTNEIYKLLKARPVKRLARIFQLGNKILSINTLSHTRLEHCKGTYFRTLEMLMHVCEQPDIKQLIENKNLHKYLVAELVRSLLHDLGHGPFSHTLETVCRLPKGFHEVIGSRIIQEDEEVVKALEGIYQNLPNLIKEIEEKNFLGLNCLFEGQFDVDRADFVLRDLVYFSISGENKEIRDTIDELLQNFKLVQINQGDKKKIIPVFNSNQMSNLTKFLKIRNNSYRKIYYSEYGKKGEHIFRKFADELLETDEEYELKDYLSKLYKANPNEVDLKQYTKFDDIEYLRGIVEIYKKTKNDRLKKLAICCIPREEALQDIFYGAMVSVEQIDEDGIINIDAKDRKLFRDISNIRSKIGDEDFSNTFFKTISCKDSQELDNKLQQMKEIIGETDEEELDRCGIFFDISKNAAYKRKKGEEIYVEAKDGNIYEYSEHPELEEPIETFENCIIILDTDQMSRSLESKKNDEINRIYDKDKEIA